MENELLTTQGYDRLSAEIRNLTLVERPKIIEEVQIARDHGDLKENAEYHSAREKQRLIDKKIGDLQKLLTHSQIWNSSESNNYKVGFGSTVTILDLNTDEEETYTIVGTYEADSTNNIISYHSPLAKSMLEKEVEDEIELQLPSRIKEFEIIKIEYKGLDFANKS
jgi:transcription elongation factor GreA